MCHLQVLFTACKGSHPQLQCIVRNLMLDICIYIYFFSYAARCFNVIFLRQVALSTSKAAQFAEII